MSTVLVTGATGFVGTRLCAVLAAQGFNPRPASRAAHGDFAPTTDWREAVQGCDAVVHLMARVHQPPGNAAAALYRRDNVDVTLNLARQAAETGVRRFVFVSSVKVMGERSPHDWTEADAPAPQEDYARSKLVAEHELLAIGKSTGLEIVILRPPLVVGAGARANLRTLMRAVHSGVPLPLGAVHNRRSLIGLQSFAELIALSLTHPAAAGETFLAADTPALSTTELLRELAIRMQTPARLLPVPTSLLAATLRLLGRQGLADRLLGDLAVDASKAQRLLGWNPRPIAEALDEMVAAYLGGSA